MTDAAADRLSRVQTWIFDLDNTLYPASSAVFGQIHLRMAEYIAGYLGIGLAEAKEVRSALYHKYGQSLRGMILDHGMPPQGYLDYVHDIDLSSLAADDGELRRCLAALPGRRLIYTNGSAGHARNILAHLGVEDLFEGVFDIVAADFVPKPEPGPFDQFLSLHGIDPTQAAFFEDMAVNLKPAAERGVTTVYVTDDPDTPHPHLAEHIHFATDCVKRFLGARLA